MALRRWTLAALTLVVLGGCAAGPVRLWSPPADVTAIERDSVVLDVVLVPPKDKPAPPPVKRRFDAVILENRWLRVTCVPELGGRITSIVSKPSRREIFYVGPVDYSGNVFKAGGANMGGIEVNHPYLHNGNAYCNEWLWTSETRPDGAAAVTMSFTSYPLLQSTALTVSLAPEEALLRLTYRFENLAPWEMGFNPWINAVCRPGDDAEIILPGEWITDHWFGANKEERFHQLYPWPVDKDGVDRSRLKNNPDGLTAFAYGFTEGYAGVYYHDQDAGFVRVFDPRQMRGAKAWVGKKGWPWFEMWGAVHQNMEAPGWLGPHESLTVSDAWMPVAGTGGVTWACEQGAVNFARRGDSLDVGVCVTRDLGACAVRVVADGRTLLRRACRLDPEHPLRCSADGVGDADEARLEVVDSGGRAVLVRQLHLAPHPRAQFALPEKPWFRRNALAEARWHESFSPLCNWGPWWPPVQSYENVLKAEPQNREARLALARALLKDWASGLETLPDGGRRTAQPDPKKLARATELLKELVAAGGSKPDALYLLGLAQMWAGDSAAAAESFGKVVEHEAANAPANYCLALLAARQREWDDVIEHAQAAVNAAPDSTLARQLLAVGLLHDEEADEAQKVLLPLHEANPAEPATVRLLFQAAVAQKQNRRAVEWYNSLAHFLKTAPRQYEAALRQLDGLGLGLGIDSRAIDTLSGPPLPGREP